MSNVYKASLVCMMAGSDFIKTSTGKESVNAILPVGVVMCRLVKQIILFFKRHCRNWYILWSEQFVSTTKKLDSSSDSNRLEESEAPRTLALGWSSSRKSLETIGWTIIYSVSEPLACSRILKGNFSIMSLVDMPQLMSWLCREFVYFIMTLWKRRVSLEMPHFEMKIVYFILNLFWIWVSVKWLLDIKLVQYAEKCHDVRYKNWSMLLTSYHKWSIQLTRKEIINSHIDCIFLDSPFWFRSLKLRWSCCYLLYTCHSYAFSRDFPRDSINGQ